MQHVVYTQPVTSASWGSSVSKDTFGPLKGYIIPIMAFRRDANATCCLYSTGS